MLQTKKLMSLLKQQLKIKRLTYKDLALELSLSEASVKRLFSKSDVSLVRLEQICQAVDLSLADLFELLTTRQPSLKSLTLNQELDLVKDQALLLIAICVLNHWRFDDILTYYNFSEFTLIKHLSRLDKMQFLELLPGNRIKQLVHADFDWIANGPIQQFFQRTVQQEFFNSSFAKDEELLLVRCGMLSAQDNLLLQQTLKLTAEQFLHACRSSKDLPLDRRHGSALVIALRPWVPSLFDEFKKN